MALELACSEKAFNRGNEKHPVNEVAVFLIFSNFLFNFDFLTLAINLNGLLMHWTHLKWRLESLFKGIYFLHHVFNSCSYILACSKYTNQTDTHDQAIFSDIIFSHGKGLWLWVHYGKLKLSTDCAFTCAPRTKIYYPLCKVGQKNMQQLSVATLILLGDAEEER